MGLAVMVIQLDWSPIRAWLTHDKLGWQPQYADLANIIEYAWKWETRGG
jgi:UDP-glucose 4-epimerase